MIGTELGEDFKTFGAGVSAGKTGIVATSALQALRVVGLVVAVAGAVLLPFYQMMMLGFIVLIVGLIIVVLGFSAGPKGPVGTIVVSMSGYLYAATIKEKEEASCISFELRTTLGAVTSRESKETSEPKKGDPVGDDFDTVCEVIKSYLE